MQDPNQTQDPKATNLASSSQLGRPVEPPAVSGNREHGPIDTSTSEFIESPQSQPEIAPSHPQEVMIPHELKNTLEKGPDAHELKIEKDLHLSGVTLAKESTPVITTPTSSIHLPMTYAQALQKKNNSPFWDSVHWLAALIMYQWNKYEPDVVKETKTK